MKECEICWTNKEHFFNLECCPHDICKDCIEQIRNPSCPFCRSFLPILSIGRRNSISYDPPSILHENYYLWSSMDDLYLYSRWYRRRRRRIERLRQREEHDRENRERNRRRNLRREIREEVRDYLENREFLDANTNQNNRTLENSSFVPRNSTNEHQNFVPEASTTNEILPMLQDLEHFPMLESEFCSGENITQMEENESDA